MVEWNKLSFEEHDKIRKECDKKGEPSGTKRVISDISVEHVTAIIGAMQQAQSASSTKETELTSNTTQAVFYLSFRLCSSFAFVYFFS